MAGLVLGAEVPAANGDSIALVCKMRKELGCWWISDLVVTLWFGMQPFWEPKYRRHEKVFAHYPLCE